jgi:hypothetical protein
MPVPHGLTEAEAARRLAYEAGAKGKLQPLRETRMRFSVLADGPRARWR